MHGVVGAVAAEDLVVYRDRAVGGHGEAEDELFEVGSVVLVVPVRDPRRGHRAPVLSMEGDRGGVVVQAGRGDLELLDDAQGQPEPDAPAALGDQGVEHAGDAVVVERGLLVRGEGEGLGSDGLGPGGDAVERGRGIENVVDEGGESLAMIDDGLAAGADRGAHDGLEVEALDKVADDGVRAQVIGFEGGGALTSMHYKLYKHTRMAGSSTSLGKKIKLLEAQRRVLVAKLAQDEAIVVGNVYDVMRRCGNSSCHCAAKPAHRQTLLIYVEEGRRRCKFVRGADAERIKQAWERYRECKKALREFLALQKRELQVLRAQIKARRISYE